MKKGVIGRAEMRRTISIDGVIRCTAGAMGWNIPTGPLNFLPKSEMAMSGGFLK